MKLEKYSFGTGDRFAHQGRAQLDAVIKANKQGIPVTPVWNKSYREHQIIQSSPEETRKEADQSVRQTGWEGSYFVDADHIGMENVDYFLDYSNFFTIDVADFIGVPADDEAIDNFVRENSSLTGTLQIDGISEPFEVSESQIREIASDFLKAVSEVDRVYRHILEKKNGKKIVIEVSMDEVENPQTPVELLFILKMLADHDVKLDTIALKFSGRFNKGVDYVGEVDTFAREFEQDLLVIDYAVKQFGLPENLKLSIHSGSDKFSLYKPVREIIRRHNKGIHVKTAGTTWLEELIGLSLSGDEGKAIVSKIYARALDRFEELTGPYETVIDISADQLPDIKEVREWSGEKLAATLRHEPGDPDFNPHFRQLLHCAYKIAAELGSEFTDALKRHEEVIASNVTDNLYRRHIKPLFLD